MKALFISDLHLCDDRPETIRAFQHFIDGPARSADALYILGDLFEHWVGDDDITPLATLVADALATLAAGGTKVCFMAGNRDFLLGEAYARRAHLTLLPDPTLIELDGQALLLSHGDILCTDDLAYRQFRQQVRNPAWQQSFLARPLAERKRFAAEMRRQSALANAGKPAQIMDVNSDTIARMIRNHGYPALIHGHTHRPARHLQIVDHHDCERWVLSDWHADAPYLLWNEGSLEARRYAPASDSPR